MIYTSFGWSILYDFYCGIIYGTTAPSGFTSTVNYTVTGTTYYVPYTMVEITQTEYETGGCEVFTCDSLMMNVYSEYEGPFGTRMPSFYYNSGFTQTGLNLFQDCAAFATKAASIGVNVGSSTYFPEIDCIGAVIQTELVEDVNTEDNKDLTTETEII